MTYTIKGLGKDKSLAKTLLAIELNYRKIKHYPSTSKDALRIDDADWKRTKELMEKIKSPRKLKFEISRLVYK